MLQWYIHVKLYNSLHRALTLRLYFDLDLSYSCTQWLIPLGFGSREVLDVAMGLLRPQGKVWHCRGLGEVGDHVEEFTVLGLGWSLAQRGTA